MVGPRGWIFVIGLLVLTTGGDCLVNDACCVEDWEKFIAPVTKANTDHASDLKSAAFKKVIATWAADRDKMSDAELDDLCGGHIGEKCVGTKDKATCSCNKGHVVEDNKCVAEKAGDLCTQGPNSGHCKKGLTCVGTPVGECSAGGVDKPGVDGKGTASYTQRPILWVIIGGLALIPPASS